MKGYTKWKPAAHDLQGYKVTESCNWDFPPKLLGFSGDSADKESTYNVGDLGSNPGLGRFPEEGNGYPLQYSGLENSIDCMVHGDAKSWTPLSNFHFTFTFT